MAKPVTREIDIHIAHVEAALAEYLKRFFPEAAQIEGVDITLPVSRRADHFHVAVYLTTKAAANDNDKQAELQLVTPDQAEEKAE